MDDREALVALNLLDHVGPIRVRRLLEHLGSPAAILRASRATLLSVDGVGEETAGAIASWESSIDLAGEWRRIEAGGFRILVAGDGEYPPLLEEIYDPPLVLYARGRLVPRDRHAVAIVGSRLTTPYGIDTARRLAFQLAYAGITVVSGGARGIDTAAHQGALNARGRSVVVLGTGIDLVFPPENAALFERMAESGAVLSQFPLGRTADRQTFPIRNRLVAGMTLGTLVVEANLSSGALITGRFAAEYGRQVFAVPGRIDSPRSRGCHELIKSGAKLCEGLEDILTEFEYLFPPSAVRGPRAATLGPLPPAEARVLEALTLSPSSIDDVIRDAQLPAGIVSSALFSLELKRLVIQHPGRLFQRTPSNPHAPGPDPTTGIEPAQDAAP